MFKKPKSYKIQILGWALMILGLTALISAFRNSGGFNSRAPASQKTLYNQAEIFQSDFLVYQNLEGNPLLVNGRKITTSALSQIQPLSVDSGPLKAGSDKYVRVEAGVGGIKDRAQVWVHHSGTIGDINKLLASLEGKESLPWGDARITEAYQKNLGVRRSWFDDVSHFFNPESDEGKKIIAGVIEPKDLGEREKYYYIVDQENSVPVLTKEGKDTGEYLAPGSVVIVSLLRKYEFKESSQRYEKTKEFLSPLVQFQTAPNFYGEKEVQGHLHISYLGEAIRPLEDLKKLDESYERYVPALIGLYGVTDDRLTLEAALKQFHSSICMVEGVGRAALLQKWKKFVDSKQGARAKQIALNAQHVDMVARTIMGEAQNEDHLFDPGELQTLKKNVFHPKAVSCQRDIIALSIRNRALTKKFKSYGHQYFGDFTGAASTGHQYNAWFANLVPHSNYRITSCFYSDKKGYLDARKKSDSAYGNSIARYESVIRRLPIILGMVGKEEQAAATDSSYLTKVFQAEPHKNIPAEENAQALSNYRHYYHPNNGGLKKGSADRATREYKVGVVKSGLVRVMHTGSAEPYVAFYPVTNGQLTRFDKDKTPHNFMVRILKHDGEFDIRSDSSIPDPVYTFEVQVKNKWVSANAYFQNGRPGEVVAHLIGYDLKSEMAAANSLWALLPNAIFPQCFSSEGYISPAALKNGVRVPFHWFSRDVRNAAAKSFNRLLAGNSSALQNFGGGAYYAVDQKKVKGTPLYTEEGEPIQLRCVDPVYYSPGHAAKNEGFPEFGGYCDPNIMLVRDI